MEFPLHDRRRRLPREAPAGGHHVHELLSTGFDSAGILRSVGYGMLVKAGHGIYRGGAADDVVALLEALVGTGPQVASHETAAALLGMPGYELRLPLHITSPADGGRVQREGIVAHRSAVPREQMRNIEGVRLTDPARTWVDLALTMPTVSALVLADQLLRPPRRELGETGSAMVALDDLREAALTRRGSRGIRRVRQVADLARVGADSPPETSLRYAMWCDGLPEPRVNPWICDAAGRPVFQPDLGIDRFRIAIQYEGVEVHSDPDQVLHDVGRAERAEALGWLEVRMTKNHSAKRWSSGLRKIRAALHSRGWDPD